MKRSFSQVGKGGASTPTTPGMTRAFSHGSAPVSSTDAPMDSALYLARHQNKELMFALKSKKRSISDLRGQLQHEKQQTAVAEELLSVLDRSYNQFNDDISRMISILSSPSAEGEPTTHQPHDSKSKEWLSLLQTYLESGESYFQVTAVHEMGMIREEGDDEQEKQEGQQEVNMLHLRPDDWTNTAEIEELRQEALHQLDTANHSEEGGGGGDRKREGDMDEDIDITLTPQKSATGAGADVLAKGTPFSCHDRVKTINSELSQRTRSIKAKLHTLLKALQAKVNTPAALSSSSSSSSSSFPSPITQSMAQTRHLRAEKLLLMELLAKYKAEVINLQAEVRLGERRLLLQERAKHFAPPDGSGSDFVAAEEGAGAGVVLTSSSSSSSLSALLVGGATTDSGGPGDESAGSSEQLAATSTSNDDAQALSATASDVLKQQQQQAAAEAAAAAVELQAAHARQAELEVLVTVLKEQLADTEGLRSAAEQALGAYIHCAVASPPSSSSSSSGDNDDTLKLSASQRAAMEQRWSREAQELERARQLLQDTRQQQHKRLGELEGEKNHYFRRMSELELAMSVLTQASASRVEDMTEQMTTQMESTRQEKEAAVASLRTIQQELQMFELTKARLVEAETVEASTKRQCTQLSERIKSQNKTAEMTDQNLVLSRERESQLTSQLAAAALSKEQTVRQVAHAAGLKQLQDEAEEGMIPEESDVDIDKHESVKTAQQECHQALTSLVASAQARVSEVTAELVNAKENMNDLILEIESVANEEERSREHNARLVKQLGETHGVQKEMRMENLRLHHEIHELHETSVEMKKEKKRIAAHMKQQEEIIDTLKATTHRLHVEMHQLNGSLVTTSSAAESRSREREEADSRCAHAKSVTAECRRKISDLKTRCSELSNQHDSERKQRLGVQRELATAQAVNARLLSQESGGSGSDGSAGKSSSADTGAGSGGSASTTGAASSGGEGEGEGSQQQQMLDMTLNMLRCSVCHDRFKEVAITRCFHLFCRPCIDLNLSSRHRKCPACGERFGQDDVKSVFFTH